MSYFVTLRQKIPTGCRTYEEQRNRAHQFARTFGGHLIESHITENGAKVVEFSIPDHDDIALFEACVKPLGFYSEENW